MANTIKVKLVKGLIGTRQDHRATVRGLGLRRVNSVSELQDTPSVRGMINKVNVPRESCRLSLGLVNGENNATQYHSTS
jgi:large subunit ribosomal protein L30